MTPDPQDTGELPAYNTLTAVRTGLQEKQSTAFYSLVAVVIMECVFCGMRAETEETVEHEHIIHRNTAGWQQSYR